MSVNPAGETTPGPAPTEAPPATTALDLDGLNWPGPLERVGKYQLTRIIATGGMGVVYEAIQDQPHRSVALKLMRRGLGSPEAIARFESESQLLGRLQHPGIAQVYEADMQIVQGVAVPYFAMEYLADALPITDYARAHRLSLKQRIELMIQVCDAVHHGHQKGIIHRDLKPTNILIDASGHAKIIDYGVSQAADLPQAPSEMGSGTVQFAGTLPYMSPEQFRTDTPQLDARLDVYALGVVLYELLCGRLPFQIDVADVEVATRIICAGGAPRPSSIDRALRGDIEAVVLKAMHPDRQQRYTSAEHLAHELSRLLSSEPIAARSKSTVYVVGARLRRFITRHRIATALGAVVLGVAAAQWIGIPLLFHWTGIEARFERFATTRLMPAGPVMGDVRIVALTDQTDFKAIAAAHGVVDIDPANKVSLRRLHGSFMEKLAQGGPRVLVWDIGFPRETEFDDDFVAGVQALKRSGCEVIVGLNSWQPAAGVNALSTTISPHVKSGPMTGRTDPDTPWRAHLAVAWNLNLPVASASLLAAAAFVKPGTDLYVDFERRDNNLLELGFAPSNSPQTGPRRQAKEAQVWRITGVAPLITPQPRTGLEAGVIIATLLIEVPPDSLLDAVTVDYAKVFEASPAELRAQFGGKLVLIGDRRAVGGDGPFAHPDGRTMPGYVLQACAIDAFIRQEPVQIPITRELAGLRIPDLWVINAVAAMLGIGLASLAGHSHVRRVLLLALGAGLLLAASVAAYSKLHYLCNPAIAIVAMVVAAELAAFADRLRRRVGFSS